MMGYKNGISRRYVGRGVIAVLTLALAVSTSTALALSSGPRRSHFQHRHAAHGWRVPREAFAAFAHGKARAHAARVGVMPASAVLLDTVDHHEIYMWERQNDEPMSLGHRIPTSERMLCVGEIGPGGSSAGCGSATELAERGDVSFGQYLVPSTGKESPLEVTVLVPNGVPSVKFTDADGTSYEVKVTNNVVVVEDNKLAPPPATAVSFKLPDGKTRTARIPGGM